MSETYTLDQAMERLGIRSRNAFKHLAKKYPEAFVLLKQGSSKFPRYDKDALDRLAKERDTLKAQIHGPRPAIRKIMSDTTLSASLSETPGQSTSGHTQSVGPTGQLGRQ